MFEGIFKDVRYFCFFYGVVFVVEYVFFLIYFIDIEVKVFVKLGSLKFYIDLLL